MSPCPARPATLTSPGSRTTCSRGWCAPGSGRPAGPRAAAEPVAEVDPVAQVLVDVPLAHLDRTFDYAVPASMADDGATGRAGQGAVRGPRRRRLRARAGGGHRPRRLADAAAAGGQPRAGAVAPGGRARRRTWPSATPAPAPTCCGWPCRAGTRPPRRRTPWRRCRHRRTTPGRPRPRGPTTVPRPPSSDTWPTAARRERSGAPRPAPTGRRSSRTPWPPRVAGGRGALVVVPDGKDVARVDAALTARARRRPARRAHRGRRAGEALPRLPGRRTGSPPGRGRHPRRGVRAGRRARPGRDLGRRRRPARRAAGALPTRPRDPAAARRARGDGRAGGGLRDERRGGAAGPLGLGAPARRLPRGAAVPGHRLGRRCRRARAGPRPAGPGHPGADRGAPRDPRRARDRTGARADPAQRVRRGAGLRALPDAGALPGLHRPARARLGHRTTDLPLVRRARRGLGLSRVRPPRAAGAGRGGDPDRGGARPVVRRHRGPHARAATGCWPRSTTSRRSWWPRRARSRWPRVATRPSSCSTPGWCSAWPTCGSRRRRCGAGPTPSVWSAPAVARSWSATRPTRRCRRWSAGTRPASRPARPRSAARRTCRPPPGSRPSPASPAPSTTRSPCSTPPIGFELLGPVPFGPDGESRAVVRVPRSHGADLSRALGEVQRVRSARKLDAVRIQVDPPTL